MAYNGSGTFNRPVSPYVYDTVISETDVNAEMDGIATGLSNVICKDGQTTPTGNLPMGTYRHTGVGNASARTDYAAAGQVQDSSFTECGTAGGTKNALTLTTSPAITAYAMGQRFRFKAGATQSDDAVTIAVSGLPAKAAQIDDAALSASVCIDAGKHYEAFYDGASFQLTRLSAMSLRPSLNLSDLSNTATAVGNLGLSNAAKTDVAQAWTKPQRPTATDTRTTGGTVTLDFTAYQNFAITLSSALTLGAPTIDASCVGQKGTIRIIPGSYTTPGGWWSGLKRVSSDGTTTMASVTSFPSSGVVRMDYEVISTTRIVIAYAVEEA